jgi:predicted PurR-regulated permease PerM
MKFPDRRTANVLLTILLFAAVLAIVYAARSVLVVFFFAILFAYLLEPVVRFQQRHSLLFKKWRRAAVVEAYLAFLILIVVLAHDVVPGLIRRTGQAFDQVPVLLNGLSTGETATELGNKYGWSEAQTARLRTFLRRHREKIQDLARAGDEYTSKVPQAIAWLVVIPILAIFFLFDGPHIASALIRIASMGGKYPDVQEIAEEMNLIVRKYIRAKATLCGLSFVFYSTAMLFLRFPHAIAIGFAGGVLEFVPVAGWMTSAVAILSVGALAHAHWIWMAALLGIWRLIQDYVTTPRVMGHELEIHPLMVIFALMVGWEIGGLVGIYLLVPVIAGTRVIWRRYVFPGPQVQGAPILVSAATSDGVFQAASQNPNAQATALPEPTGRSVVYGDATLE